MHESKIELRRELEQLTARHEGPISWDRSRITVTLHSMSGQAHGLGGVPDPVRSDVPAVRVADASGIDPLRRHAALTG